MAANARIIAHAMDLCQEQQANINMGDDRTPLRSNGEGNIDRPCSTIEKPKVGDKRFFVRKALSEIPLSIYTMVRTLVMLFLDITLCVKYYMNDDLAWCVLTMGIIIISNLVSFIWMISIQYGSKSFKDITVLIDEEKRSHIGIIDEIKKRFRKYCGNCCGASDGVVKTTYHIKQYYRVFYFEDDPDKVYNVTLPRPPSRMSLKFRGWCLPLLAIIGQLPTYLEYMYLNWRRLALVSLRHNGNKYHKRMIKCVFVKNILQMVLIIGFGERALQLFLQIYIVTQADIISPLQLSQICVGFFAMLFSSVYVQTISSFMNRNLWDNGLKSYIGTLMVYVSMMFLALTSLVTIFIYAAIFDQALAFASFSIFMIFVFSHVTREMLKSIRSLIVLIAQLLFWLLFIMFIYSDYYWHQCMVQFGKHSSTANDIPAFTTNSSLMICNGARIAVCNETLISSTYSFWSFSDPFVCISFFYDKLYFTFNIVPYVTLLFAFISPLYKGFEYYYDYKPNILPGASREDTANHEMDRYYKELERKLAIAGNPAIIVRAVKMGEKDPMSNVQCPIGAVPS